MLGQTLREWEQHNFRRGREEGIHIGVRRGREEGVRRGREEGVRRGREEGVRRGREEERRLLCSLAARRFGDATADAIRPLLGSLHDEARFAAVGALIVDSRSGAELLDGTRRLAKPNNHHETTAGG